jgi:hypothetical protein
MDSLALARWHSHVEGFAAQLSRKGYAQDHGSRKV